MHRYAHVLVTTVLTARLFAQAPPPPPPPPPGPPTWTATSPVGASAKFEVATVRINKSLTPFAGGVRPGEGSLTATSITLEALVAWAYGVRAYQLVGFPGWARSERYDVSAKPQGAPDTVHLRLLLQALLKERFKLVVHKETRQVPVYRLKVEPKGSKMKRSTGVAQADAPQLSGVMGATRSQVIGKHATMDQLTPTLSMRLGRPVLDETGLAGGFDFKLEWVPDEAEIARLPAIAQAAADPQGVSLFTAIKEQLGLRLEAGTGPGEVIVFESSERVPVEN